MQGGGYITLDFRESKSSELRHKAIIMNTQIMGIGLKGDTVVIDSELCPQVSVQRVEVQPNGKHVSGDWKLLANSPESCS